MLYDFTYIRTYAETVKRRSIGKETDGRRRAVQKEASARGATRWRGATSRPGHAEPKGLASDKCPGVARGQPGRLGRPLRRAVWHLLVTLGMRQPQDSAPALPDVSLEFRRGSLRKRARGCSCGITVAEELEGPIRAPEGRWWTVGTPEGAMWARSSR